MICLSGSGHCSTFLTSEFFNPDSQCSAVSGNLTDETDLQLLKSLWAKMEAACTGIDINGLLYSSYLLILKINANDANIAMMATVVT